MGNEVFERKYKVELSGWEIALVELGVKSYLDFFEIGNIRHKKRDPIPLESEANVLIERLKTEYPQILKEEPITDPRLLEIIDGMDRTIAKIKKQYGIDF